MIKVILHVTKVIIAIAASLLFLSCGLDFKRVDGSGNVVTKERKLSGEYKAISAGSGLEVIIEQGQGYSVTVEADDNLHQHIKTEVKDGELEISADVNIGNAASKKVIVRLPHIESIDSGSGSSVSARNTIKSESISLSSGSGGSLNVAIEAKSASCESGSGSKLKVSGKVNDLQTESSSGSSLNARELTAGNVKAEASSGGHTYVNAIKRLSADASSGGKIMYSNTPEKLDKETSSGGEVSQE